MRCGHRPSYGAVVDLDLRLVRYFAAVAEHRHFGRAAAALHVAQPSLSRQIRSLEEQLGVVLFDRTPRGVDLTEAGAAFLPRARALLQSAAEAVAQARSAAEPTRITIGYIPGTIVTAAVRELRRRHPSADVRTRYLAWHEPREALLDHRVDAALLRLPAYTDGLSVTALYDEPRAVVLPSTHRLAGKDSLTLDDIADEPMPRLPGVDPAWASFWLADPRPDGRPAPDGPVLTSVEDKFELIASGEAVVIMPAGFAALRPDLTEVPLHGVAPCTVALATRPAEKGRLVSDFRAIARRYLNPTPSR
jgi:DNA-binding transcriptional LysR family regulator